MHHSYFGASISTLVSEHNLTLFLLQSWWYFGIFHLFFNWGRLIPSHMTDLIMYLKRNRSITNKFVPVYLRKDLTTPINTATRHNKRFWANLIKSSAFYQIWLSLLILLNVLSAPLTWKSWCNFATACAKHIADYTLLVPIRSPRVNTVGYRLVKPIFWIGFNLLAE